MSIQNLEPILAEHPFVQSLPKEYLPLIVGCAKNVVFKAGEFLFREGQEAKEFYLIRRGKVSLEIYAAHKGAITIETVGEKEIIGWSWLLPPYNWHFDAKAVELTRCIALDGECLRNKCEQDHSFGYPLLKWFAYILQQRLSKTRLQLLDVYDETYQSKY